ncbi:hypothetical protein MASR2M48_23020 [Spirochaetota bacterium]
MQNVAACGSIRDQSLAVAIELARYYIGKTGALRVHGGGFAGTIQAYVRTKQAEGFTEFMDGQFGAGATNIIHIRPDGAGEALV